MGLIGLYHRLCDVLTEDQAKAVVEYARQGTQKAAARKLLITQPSLHGRLVTAQARLYARTGQRIDWRKLVRQYRRSRAEGSNSLVPLALAA